MSGRFHFGFRTAIVSLGQTVARLSDLLVALLLVRLLTDSEWAAIALLLSIYAAGIGIGGLHLHQGIFFFYGRLNPLKRRALAVQTTLLLAAAGTMAAAIVFGLQFLEVSAGSYDLSGLLPWLALALILEIPTIGAPQLLLAAERPVGSAVFSTTASVTRVSAIAGPAIAGLGLEGSMIGLAVYALLRLGAYLAVLVAVTPSGPIRVDWELVKEQVLYTAPLALSIASTALNTQLGKWLVAAFDTPNFGAYAIAATEVPFVSILPYAVGAVLATRLVHAFKEGNPGLGHAYWLASTSRMSLWVVPATVGIVIAAPQIVTLLFTEQYAAATVPFQIYTLILLHRVAEYGIVLRAAGDTRSLWLASVVLLLTNIALSLPLTLRFGMIGTASGMLAANVVAWIFVLARIRTVLTVPWRDVFPWPHYARVLSVALVAALLTLQLTKVAPPVALWQLILRLTVFTGLTIICVRFWGLHTQMPPVPKDDAAFIRDTAPQPKASG